MTITAEEIAASGLEPGAVAILGLPYDGGSSFLRGPARGPAALRSSLRSGASNLTSEAGTDLEGSPRLVDLGDLDLGAQGGGELPVESVFERVEQAVDRVLAAGATVLSLGGDHSLTLPILRAYARRHPDLEILQLDAHADLYDEFEGDRFSHACPFARIMEEGLAGRLVQVGIRTLNPHQRRQAERFGVEVHEMRAWRPGTDLGLRGPLYLSLDLDVLDPAFAPGLSHPEPGGLSTRELLSLLAEIRLPLVGADLVELNPDRDPAGLTAVTAAKLAKELAAKLLE